MKAILARNSTAIIGLIVALVFSSCNVYNPALKRGDDELAFTKSVRKLNKRPNNQKAILALEKAYNRMEAKDLRDIRAISLEGNPSDYPKLFAIYDDLTYRQSKIDHLLPLQIKKENRYAGIELLDYEKERLAAKRKAAEYLYVSSQRLLESGLRHDSRFAFEQLLDLKSFYPDFRDVNRLLDQAAVAGKSNVLLSVVNSSGFPIADPLFNNLTRVAVPQLQWSNLHTSEFSADKFDYAVNFVLDDVFVGPEMIKEKQYHQEAEIFVEKPKKGINGVTEVDSTGKKIKIKVPKTIYSNVTEVERRKESWISGRIEIIDAQSNSLIHSQPVQSRTEFFNHFAVASGNFDALNKETKALVDNAPQAFPSDFELMQNNIDEIKRKLVRAVKEYRHLIL